MEVRGSQLPLLLGEEEEELRTSMEGLAYTAGRTEGRQAGLGGTSGANFWKCSVTVMVEVRSRVWSRGRAKNKAGGFNLGSHRWSLPP